MPKNKIGTCVLCNAQNITLTEEYIFPGAKRNRSNNLPFQATLNDTISTPIAQGRSTMNFEELKKGWLGTNKAGKVYIVYVKNVITTQDLGTEAQI